ncbi:hypothetical protein LSTR_LSTR013900 [Laodelphax striatellus]|uniref:BTB domain-containing protein n=1 Tax=Laodelphax striatellus TaxID=195883 RepID=A0A482X4J6_LAOST|nr:hypothetical protein LSTR_LSTR013900 [Laodelphax striatellus]
MSAETGNEVIKQRKVIDENPGKIAFQKRFLRFAESDIYSDCQFMVGPEKTIIKGHKLIYSAASEVFEAMFYGPLKEDMSVNVDDLSAEGFQCMKTFIYTGDISFTSAIQALLTYIAARKYLVTHLDTVCRNFIEEKIQSSDVLEFCDICLANNITEFKDLCLKIIQDKTDEVVDSEYFVLAESDTIELILKLPGLKLTSEIELFAHFERWALEEAKRRQMSSNEIASSFDNLKKHIRFLTVNGDEFVSRIYESVLLTQEEKHAIAINQIKLMSKPLPDSISLIQQPRDFNLFPSEYHQSTHKFTIPIDKVSSSEAYTMTMTDPSHSKYSSQFNAYWDHQFGLIYFRLETLHSYRKAMFIIKSKFRALADDKCDDLVFENEYKDIANLPRSIVQRTIYLAVIPIIELQNERFLKSISDRVINIECEFKIKKINL